MSRLTRATMLVAAAALGGFGGCSAVTSFDGFVGPDDLGFPGSLVEGGTTPAPAADAADGADPDGACTLVSTGPATGTVSAVVGSGAGWLEPAGALAPGGAAARSELGEGGADSALLVVKGFGIALPPGARVRGLRLAVLWRKVAGEPRDGAVQLVVNGQPNGANRSRDAALPDALASAVYGSAADTWDLPLTPELLASPELGAAIQVRSGAGGSAAAEVDLVTIDVDFCAAR
jgi:hypothetical protein